MTASIRKICDSAIYADKKYYFMEDAGYGTSRNKEEVKKGTG